jgi:site-specific DNA-methyltransferase (adenine-specific)
MKHDPLAKNKIYHSDVFDFLGQLDDQSVGLAIVDPPYNMNKSDWDTFDGEIA